MVEQIIDEQQDLLEDELLDAEQTETCTAVTNQGLENFNKLSQTNARQVVTALQNKELINIVETDEEIKTKVREGAKEIIHTELDTEKQIRNTENSQAHLERNRYACSVYGVDENCPKWQQKLMKIGAGFWFCIYWFIATLTITPIIVFAGKLATILKKNWIGYLLAVIFYVIIVLLVAGTPALVNYIQSLNPAS